MMGALKFGIILAALAIGFSSLISYQIESPSNPHDGAMFAKYPLSGKKKLNSGTVSVPFHAYDADASIVGCIVPNAGDIQPLLKGPFRPITNQKGEGYAFVWIMDYADTAIGPYKEVVFTFLTTLTNTTVEDHGNPYIGASLLFTDPTAKLYVHKLWLDTDVAIDYGRDILGVDKYKGVNKIVRNEGKREFSFADKKSNKMVLSGLLQEDDSVLGQLAQFPLILGAYGPAQASKIMFSRHLSAVCAGAPGVSPSFRKHNPLSLSEFGVNPFAFLPKFQQIDNNDQWNVEWPEYKALNMKPVLLIRDPHFQFVMLNPFNGGDGPEGSSP